MELNIFLSGFPHLPASFYEKSYFTQDSKLPLKNCHGTAANMFRESQPTNRTSEDGDYRVMMCIGDQLTDEDLVTVTHEMGHVYYFMAYSHLKPIFQVLPPYFILNFSIMLFKPARTDVWPRCCVVCFQGRSQHSLP